MRVETENQFKVKIVWLEVKHLYIDALEGTPELLSRLHRENLNSTLSNRFRNKTDVLILDSDSAALPEYRFLARLKANPILKDSIYSELCVCWYEDKLNGDLNSIVNRLLSKINWASQAKDVGFDDL
jgi:hypothetical protein